MTPSKHISLQKHLEGLKSKLQSTDIPERHRGSEKEYKAYLALEIKRTELRLETDAVVAPKAK